MSVEDQVEIFTYKRQTERDEYEWNNKEFIPELHIMVSDETSAACDEKESENVLVQEIQTEQLIGIDLITKRQA